jgi:DNA-directed RNA polymerase subunit RPC12/RpoP
MNRRKETMRQFLAVLFLGSALALFGLVTTEVPSLAAETAKPLIKCDTCGVEFTSQAGMEDHYRAYPEHRKAAPPEAAKPLIKCATCGVEFTSQAGLEEHLKAHPTHEAAVSAAGAKGAAKPLIKCSTCGVEFTTLKEEAEHMKAHPEHKMVPAE